MTHGHSKMRALGLAGLLIASVGSAQTTTSPTPAPPAASGVVPPPVPTGDLFNPIGGSFSNLSLTEGEAVRAAYKRALSFAACAFSDRDAARVLNTPVGSADEGREITRFMRGNLRCADVAHDVSVRMMRSAMAEQLLKRRSSEPTDGLRVQPPLFDGSAPKSLVNASKLALCHAAAEPAAARGVLGTSPGSAEELRAEAGLFAAAPSCAGTVRPAGLDPVIYRGLLASALASDQAGRS